MATKRVNLTLNSDNYADSLIINLLGGGIILIVRI